MLAAYFGDIASGEIGRGRFFALSVSLTIVFAMLSVGLGLGFGLKNVLPLFVPVAALLTFAHRNLAAKRWRSIGFPGWTASLGIAAVVTLMLWYAPRDVALLAILSVFLVEVAWPSKGRKSADL